MSIYAIVYVHLCFDCMATPQQISRINSVLYHIHRDISADLQANELAKIAAYSEQHFHRLFKQVVGESIHQYIRRTRMEHAANLLMFDHHASVLTVANKCGFNSASSFSRAFKTTFGHSPGEWRQWEEQDQNRPYLLDAEIAQSYQRIANTPVPSGDIQEVEERHVAYVRHLGYNRSIKQAWQRLIAWAKVEKRSISSQFGLHHSNPEWVKLEKCRYVACIEIDRPVTQRGIVSQLTIPGGLYAIFHLQGKYGELLPQISQIMEHWLPESGFKMRTSPAYVHYQKNHFIEADEKFELDFHLPISFY